MNIEQERKELIKKMNSMGVSHVRGKNPYTIPIDQLKELVDFLEKRKSDSNQ